MKKTLLSMALCASMMFAASNSEYKYEITPMLAGTYAEGNLNLDRNQANAGLALGINLDDYAFDQIELGFLTTLGQIDYKNSSEETQITRFFTNAVKEYKITNSTSLYALVGAGVEWFSNEKFNNETGLFGNYGFGVKYKISDDMALKADVRHLIETDHGDNNLLYTVGLSILFGKKAPRTPMSMEKEKPMMAEKVVKTMEKDSDGDGVLDSKDKCPNTPKGDIVDKNGCSLKVDLNINFDFDSSRIKNSYESKIKKFAQFMKAFPSVKGKIEAHTDSKGTEEYNQKLSERRAASTVKALEAYGVNPKRLNSIGYGESKPIASNKTEEGRAKNRRVEGSIYR